MMRYSYGVLTMLVLMMFLCTCGESERNEDHIHEHVDSVIAECQRLLYSDPVRADSVIVKGQEGLADSLEWHRLELFRAMALHFMGDDEGMGRARTKVRKWCESHPDAIEVESKYWNHCGVDYSMSGIYDSACYCYEKSYELLRRIDDGKGMISTCINLADASFLSGRLPEAANYFRRAEFLSDSLELMADVAAINTGLGRVYGELQNFSEAHKYFDAALQSVDAVSEYDAFILYTSIGNCYYFERRYADALRFFMKARELELTNAVQMYAVHCESNIGELHLLMGHVDEARPYIHRVLDYVDSTENCDPSVKFYVLSLAMSLALDEHKYADAKEYLSRVETVENVQIPRYRMLHYGRLQRYFEDLGDYRNAYTYQQIVHRYSDSLRNQLAVNNVNEMKFRYDLDTTVLGQRLVIAEYGEQTLLLRSYVAYAVSGIIVLIVIAVALFYYVRHRNSMRLRRQFDEIVAMRMNVVRNRMSPHYVFNVLGAVLPRFRVYPELAKPLELLIDVLRGNLLVSEQMAQPLEDEVSMVKRYVELYHLSTSPYPEVEWDIDGEVPCRTMIPTMCIQIPVENALKHAFIKPEESSKVVVRISSIGDGVSITVTDNGRGYNPGRIERTGRDTGIGLNTISRTVELLNANNDKSIKFCIRNLEAPSSGTIVAMFIPTDYKYDVL